MSHSDKPLGRLRFEGFELLLETGELIKNGRRIRLQEQPSRLLILLATRPGELVTRTEIQQVLWEDGRFVEVEHGINTAIKKVREVLGDDPEHPRIIETLPKKGYRFIASIEAVAPVQNAAAPASPFPVPANFREPETAAAEAVAVPAIESIPDERHLEESFAMPQGVARSLFLLIQGIYVWIYGFTLIHMQGLDRVLTGAGFPFDWLPIPILIAAACGIGLRIYLISGVGLAHPAAVFKYRRILPYLMAWDWLWSLSPLLVAPTIEAGWAIILVAGLAWLPFSQRTLMRSIYRSRAV